MSHHNYNTYFTPFGGMPARVVKLEDDSYESEEPGSRICGELELCPHFDSDNLKIGDKSFERKAFIYSSKEEVSRRFFHEVKEGDHVFLYGDLSRRHNLEAYPHLKVVAWIDEFVLDSSKGTKNPYSAFLASSDPSAYEAAADNRFAENCPHCKMETQEVPGQDDRFCPSCEG